MKPWDCTVSKICHLQTRAMHLCFTQWRFEFPRVVPVRQACGTKLLEECNVYISINDIIGILPLSMLTVEYYHSLNCFALPFFLKSIKIYVRYQNFLRYHTFFFSWISYQTVICKSETNIYDMRQVVGSLGRYNFNKLDVIAFENKIHQFHYNTRKKTNVKFLKQKNPKNHLPKKKQIKHSINLPHHL